jgi:replicative DNA helicase
VSVVFCDTPSERAVLAGICQYGSEAYFDIVDLLQESTFTDEINNVIFRCLKHILDKDDTTIIDIPVIQDAGKSLGVSHIISKREELQFIQALFKFPISLDNVRRFAAKLRKLEISKLLHKQLGQAQDKMLDVTGDETIAEILGMAEDAVLDLTSLLNNDSDSPERLGENAEEYLQYLIDNPVKQIGISTGFPAWDQSIGGGLRVATINVVAARPKVGKTLLSDNVGYNIAKQNIPVLNMDTEMTKEDHIHRMIAMLTEIPINDIETGKFGNKPDWKDRAFKASKHLSNLPYDYKSIAGKPFEEQIALMRRWITRSVGLNPDGTAKPCVIIYDYLKLMDSQGISQDLKEYQLLGFMMTTLHNFATRYKIPILAFMQLNRDGINKESTDTASGSDRIIWLCSNFSIFKYKSDEEMAEDGAENGNRKLVPIITRHGEGLDQRDYINCYMKGWCAKIVEGKTKFELVNEQQKKQDGFVDDGTGDSIDFD